MINKGTLIVIVVLFISSCMRLNFTVSPTDIPNAGKSYVFLRFIIPQWESGLRFAVVIKEVTTTEEVVITTKPSRLSERVNEDSVFVVPINPGTYKIEGIMFVYGMEASKKDEICLTDAITIEEIEMMPNKAYYLGDYYIQSTMRKKAPGTLHKIRIEKIENNYKETLSSVRTIYDNFHDVEMIDPFEGQAIVPGDYLNIEWKDLINVFFLII